MKVSVLIPTYNRSDVLRRSLESLQRLQPDQVVVVNDASTDDTLEVLKSFKTRYSNLSVISNKKRSKTAISRNKGIGCLSSEIIFITDDDHLYPDPDTFQKIKMTFEERHDVGIIVLRQVTNHTIPASSRRKIICKLTEWIDIDNRKKGFVKYGTAAMAVRREVLNCVRYDESYKGSSFRGENQFQTDAKKMGWKIFFDPEIYYEHVETKKGGFRDIKKDEQYYWAIRNHTYFLKKNFPDRLPLFFFLFGQASLRRGVLKSFLKAFNSGLSLPLTSTTISQPHRAD